MDTDTIHDFTNRDLLDLVARAQAGDQDAMMLIIKNCRSIIRNIIRRHRYSWYLSDDDLAQEASIVIIEVVRRLDREIENLRGYFKVAIERRLLQVASASRSALSLSECGHHYYHIERAITAAVNAGKVITNESLASIKHNKRTVQAYRAAKTARELDEPTDDGRDRHECISTGDWRVTERQALDNIYRRQARAAIEDAITILTPRQHEALHCYLAGETLGKKGNAWQRAKKRLSKALADFAPPPTRAYRGVRKYRSRFRAGITAGGKYTDLGFFGSEIEAARAYDEAARKYHGEKAKLNFPQRQAA
jgi:hypothetical protein